MVVHVKYSLEPGCMRCLQNRLATALAQASIPCKITCPTDVEIVEPVDPSILDKLQEVIEGTLKGSGIRLMLNRKDQVIDAIRSTLDEMVEPVDDTRTLSIPIHLTKKLPYSYSHLSRLFKDATHLSPEKYLMQRRIARVKELLQHDGLTLTEISYRLGYSSVAHLSNQFRRVTGISAKQWKLLREKEIVRITY